MKVNLTKYLNEYLDAMTKDFADPFIEVGLARMVYVCWASENGFIQSEGDHLDPVLDHFPEMKEAFRDLANENPLLCAILLMGWEKNYVSRKKEVEEFEKLRKSVARGRKKTTK